MALLKCSECEKEISCSATACPNCGCTKPFKGQKLSANQSKQLSGKERRSFMKSGGKLHMSGLLKFSVLIISVFIGFIALMVILSIVKPLTPTEQAQAAKEAQEKGIRVACMTGIQQRLKDPDSVVYKYGPGDRLITCDGENRWTVQLKLKAKNSFNAYVPSTFMCKVALEGQDYRLLSINEVK